MAAAAAMMAPARSARPRAPAAGARRGLLAALMVLGAGGCLLCGAACRTAAPRVSEQFALAQELRARGLDPAGIVIPWQINGAMREWVHKQVPDDLPVEARLTRLLGALLGSDGLALAYSAGTTSTAEEVFASHLANCLGFTGLFVGMGRELGVAVFYLDVGDVEKFERDGNLVVESGHVTAGFGSGTLFRVLEFTPIGKPNYRLLHRISDLTAIALYYSNRGAELLRAGKEREALGWLRKATLLDPELARGWINYGVALRRTGDAAGAEAAFRKALASDPGAAAAYQNLAGVLYASGRSREADQLMALSGKLDSRNPFNFLALGDVALAQGRTEEARDFYRKAEHLEGAEAEAEAALGQLALASGDRRAARRWLHKAAARDDGNQRVRSLAAQLGEALPRKAVSRQEPAAKPSSPPAAGPGGGHQTAAGGAGASGVEPAAPASAPVAAGVQGAPVEASPAGAAPAPGPGRAQAAGASPASPPAAPLAEPLRPAVAIPAAPAVQAAAPPPARATA